MTEPGNLSLWRLVERTDPAHVKPITGKSYSGNSPKPHYIVHRATETFGPIGIGWGFRIVEDKILSGALLEPGHHEQIHQAKVAVWYEWNGKRGEIEHVGQTLFSGRRKGKDGKPGLPFTDEDAPKKSVTDALIKALSMIGFAGDIFMGRYDDSKYAQEVAREIADEQRLAAQKSEDEARERYIAACHREIEKAPDSAKLKAWWQSDNERKARADFELNDAEMTDLKDALKDRLSALAKLADNPFDDEPQLRPDGRDIGRSHASANTSRRAA